MIRRVPPPLPGGPVLRLLDQRLLPGREVWLELEKAPEIALAIRDMAVRGAPAIGVAAAYGAAFSMRSGQTTPPAERFATARDLLAHTRPTARNLFGALERLERRFDTVRRSARRRSRGALVAEADALAAEDIEACRRIGAFGAGLLGGRLHGPDPLQRRARSRRRATGPRSGSSGERSRRARPCASSPPRPAPSSREPG